MWWLFAIKGALFAIVFYLIMDYRKRKKAERKAAEEARNVLNGRNEENVNSKK
jgi:hypothetical protein